MYRNHYPNNPEMRNGDHSQRDYERSSHASQYRQASTCSLLSQSFIQVLFGVLLIAASVGLLCWNEARAVRETHSLDEGVMSVVALTTTEVTFDELNGKLVYCQGSIKCSKVVVDNAYGVALSAAKLLRKVEMYQWVESQDEKETNEGRGWTEQITTYSYDKKWMEELVPSSGFNSPHVHRNPDTMLVKTEIFVADEVYVGNILLSKGLVNQIASFKDVVLKELPENRNDVQLYGNYFYHSAKPNEPSIGDIRVEFSYAGLCVGAGRADVVSVVAKQSGNRLETYRTQAGDDLEILVDGSHSVQKLFSGRYAQNTLLTAAYRSGGWVLSFVGFTCLTRFVLTFVHRLHLLRELVLMGVTAMNLGLATSLSLTVIALSWLAYRPLLCACILVVAMLPAILPSLRTYFARERSRICHWPFSEWAT